ncbi:hypothetical protein Pan216_45510 [Planctomycetes bacterium Pan216]|uniref:FG-GAP repeat protein n=1 Tax=Kolteria novifilia TaxID=2527975 RepID=A0A518B9K6_9BACT|nr:hypothetical protein Pan216_45510 [Planctomycetes bacterium Pan216]
MFLPPRSSGSFGPLSPMRKFLRRAHDRLDARPLAKSREDGPFILEHSFAFEALSDRITPATFNLVGPTLQLSLDVNEIVTISTEGVAEPDNGMVFTLTGTTWSGTNKTNATGDGTDTLNATNNGAAILSVVITGAGNNTVDFGATAEDSPLNSDLDINLTSAAGLTNTEVFEFGVSSTLDVNAPGANFTQSGNGAFAFSQSPIFALGSGGDLLLDAAGNDFNGQVIGITSAGDVTLVDADANNLGTMLGTSVISGDLSVTNTGAAAAAITDAGIVAVGGTSDFVVSNTTGGAIALDNFSNQFGGAVSATNSGTASTAGVSIKHATSMILGDISVTGTGTQIVIEAEDSISQFGAITAANSANVIFATNSGSDVLLNNAANDIGVGDFVLNSDAANVTVSASHDLTFDAGGNSITENLTLISVGAIDQASAISVAGETFLDAGTSIDLSEATNDFNGVQITQSSVDDTVEIEDGNDLVIYGGTSGDTTISAGGALTLGLNGGFTMTADGVGDFQGSTIDIRGANVDLGDGNSNFDATSNNPITISSVMVNETVTPGRLFFGDTSTIDAPDGFVVDADSVLGGTGTLDVGFAGLIITEDGVLTGGTSPGRLDVTGLIDFEPGAVLLQEIEGTDAGEFDQVVATGTIDIEDAILNILLGSTFDPVGSVGQTITILSSGALITGEFANVIGGQVIIQGVAFGVTYNDLSVQLTVLAGNINNVDGIGVYRPSSAEFVFNTSDPLDAFSSGNFFGITFGDPDESGFVGEFIAPTVTNVGVRRGNQFIINTSPITNFNANTYVTATIGVDSDQVLIGDWDGDGRDDIGLFRGETATYVTINLPTLTAGQTGDITTQLGIVRNITFGNPVSDVPNQDVSPTAAHFISNVSSDQIGFQSNSTLQIANVDISTLPAGNSSITAFFQPSPLFFGTIGDQTLNGQWEDGDINQRGIHRSSSATFSLAAGSNPNLVFGVEGDVGIRGNWIGASSPPPPPAANLISDEGLIDALFDEDDEKL